MELDIDKIQEVVSRLQRTRDTLNKISESGSNITLHWTTEMGSKEHYHEITRQQEHDLRKVLLEYWNDEFKNIEDELLILVNED